jgi:hypothetical protein
MVAPCSLMACEALSYVFADLQMDDSSFPALSNLSGSARGMQLELHIFGSIIRLSSRNTIIQVCKARTPNSKPDVGIRLSATTMRMTRSEDLGDIEALPGQRSLWIPKSEQSRFDGVVMPALEDLGTEAMIVFDPSVTEPYEIERRKKATVLSVLCAKLNQRFPQACSAVPLVIWDGDLSSLGRSAKKSIVRNMPENVVIMDRAGLRALGVKL